MSRNSSDSCAGIRAGVKNFLFQLNRQKFEIKTATLSPVWREFDPENAYSFDPVPPESITDPMAQEVVSRAKRRFEMATGQAISMERGLCYLAADEFEHFFTEQGIAAKCVRVMPKAGGSDHYFTVIKPDGKGDPLIVDATWKQFYKNGAQPSNCLIGTLSQIKFALSETELNIDLHSVYAAGTKVVDHWDNYSCFS